MTHRTATPALALILAAAAGLAGCAATPAAQPNDDIVIIAGSRTGSPRITPEELDGALARLDTVGDRVTVVVADGEPRTVVDLTLSKLPDNSLDREEKLAQLRSDVVTAVLSHPAKAPEVDLTEAIGLGSTAFREGTNHSLMILDSGIGTAGALSLRGGRLWDEPADLLGYAKSTAALPDLSGVSVRMPRVGVVVDPQPQLTETARRQLTSIWSAYFQDSGATDVQLSPTTLVALPQTDELPTVTPVPIDRPQPPAPSGCRQLLGDSTVGFNAGSAELSETGATRALLTLVHKALGECRGSYLVGGSASSEGDEDANQTLSLSRARTVARMLAEVAGLHEDAIKVVGWGEHWACRVDDVKDGRLDLDSAARNRVVVIEKTDGKAGTRC